MISVCECKLVSVRERRKTHDVLIPFHSTRPVARLGVSVPIDLGHADLNVLDPLDGDPLLALV